MKNLYKYIIPIITLIYFASPSIIISDNIIIDSNMTFEEAIKGTKAPQYIINDLMLLDVTYYSYDNKLHKGQLVIAKSIENDITRIFELALKEKFYIEKCIPIVKYNWSDNKSMQDNNTSSFNYRKVSGSKNLSKHSYGLAIDINPKNNPVVYKNGRISPSGAKYITSAKGTLSNKSQITIELKIIGWKWGGDFISFKDYHHFQKPLIK